MTRSVPYAFSRSNARQRRHLTEMHALKPAGSGKAAIDTFTTGVLNLIIDTVFTAVKL